jgi:hypothetical protein
MVFLSVVRELAAGSGEASGWQRREEEFLAFGLGLEGLLEDALYRVGVDAAEVESPLTSGLQPG